MQRSELRKAVLAAVYLVTWLLLDFAGFLFEVAPGISPWYPPHGLSLAMLMLLGPRYIPLLAVGPLINGSLFWMQGEWAALILVSLSITLAYGAGGAFLWSRRIGPSLATLRDAGMFLAVGLLSSLVVAPLAVGALVVSGILPAGDFVSTSFVFWAGDTLGVFGVAPVALLILKWLSDRLDPRIERPRPGRCPLLDQEVLVPTGLLALFVWAAAHDWAIFPEPPLYLLSVPVLWAAYRFGSRGAAWAVLVANAGPLVVLEIESTTALDLSVLQLTLAVVSVTGIAAGAAMTEVRQTARALAAAEARAELTSELEETNSNLRERMKELRCLYRVIELKASPDIAVEDIFSEVARSLSVSMLHEADCVARIVAEDREYRSANWRVPRTRLEARISESGEDFGFVEVGYLDPRRDLGAGHGPYLEEERQLVDAIGHHLGALMKGRRSAALLAQSERLAAVGQLTGGIAHDFNNLLTVILGNAEMLGMSLRDNERLSHLAEVTCNAAERGSELTKRLLAFARQQPLMPGPVDVGERLQDMEGLLQRALGPDVEVEFDCDPEAGLATVDASQLDTAVLNICINARDAMPEGGRLTISTRKTMIEQRPSAECAPLSTGAYLAISISDTGVGMSPEIAERAFDPFFTTKEIGRGTGLGLSTVYGFAKQSNGHVTITSWPGHGTTVVIYLPLASETAVAQTLPLSDSRARAGGERILVVEDEEFVREYVRGQLETRGYEVVSVASGQEALEALDRDGPFDLLFTDLVMPGGIGGLKLAETVRAQYPRVRILLTTGYSDQDTTLSAEGLGVLRKPYRSAELAAKIRATLDTDPAPLVSPDRASNAA